jgi:cytochrome c oxidase subunit 2
MHVDLYERIWMWASGALIAVFLGSVAYVTLAQGSRPPSHVETIDPKQVFKDPRFMNRGVAPNADGGVTVTLVGMMFLFQPNELHVPAGKPVTFRVTSADVIHGFQIVGTNGNSMVVPGYVSQFTTVFKTPGEYLIVCNEYCGLGHHTMSAKLIVEAAP